MRPVRVDQFTHPRAGQPLWLRAANHLGRLAPGAALPSADAWWEAAKKAEPDAGDPTAEAREALEVLVDSIRSDMDLSLVGRFSARDDTVRMARNHLRIRRTLRETPTVLDTPLPAPIFIIGWARTGTTALHQLLALDPRNRTIPYWESFDPVPPESGPDKRIERLDRMLAQLSRLAPNYGAIHPMTAEMPEECVALFMNELRTLQFDFQYRAPSYVEWLLAQDPTIAYRGYRTQLQLIQHHRPTGERFVLKDPTHLVHLETVLDVFPSAKLIFTHRDPAAAISSLCSLHAHTRALFTDDVDPFALGREVLSRHWADAQDRAVALRARLAPGQSTEVRHPDLLRDPLGTVARVYDDLGLEWTEAASDRIRSYIDTESKKPRSVHEHSPEGFGLTGDRIRERFATYCERFDV